MEDSKLLTFVHKELGATALSYLKNKHKGGKNNQKGTTYEDNFAVLKLAEYIHSSFSNPKKVQINSQVYAFVDDFLIEIPSIKTKLNYQLKNAKVISWHSGKHPLEADFYYQYKLDSALGISSSRTILIVSNKELKDSLINSAPTQIKNHTDCELFEPINSKYLTCPNKQLESAISKICKYSTPDKIRTLYTILMGVWVTNKDKPNTVKGLENEVRSIQLNCLYDPEINNKNNHLDPDLDIILSNINGLSYSVINGSLSYEYLNKGCRLNGYLSFDLNSQEFTDFANCVKNNRPTNFKELLELGLL